MNKAPVAAPPSETNLVDVLRVIWKYKILIAVLTLAAGCFTMFYAKKLPSEYDAVSTAMVFGGGESSGPSLSGLLGSLSGLLNTGGGGMDYETLLKSRRFALIVAKKINLGSRLAKAWSRPTTPEAPEQTAFLQKHIRLIDNDKTNVLTLQARAPEASMAADMANSYMAELQNFLAGRALTNASHNRRFIEKKLAEAKVEYNAAQEAKKQFLESNSIIVDPQSDTTAEFSLYTSLLGDLTAAETNIREINVRHSKKSSRNPFTDDTLFPSGAAFHGDPAVTKIRGGLVELELKLAEADKSFTPESEKIKKIKSDITDLKTQLRKEINNLDEVEYITSSAKIEALRTLTSQYETRFARVPGVAKEFQNILLELEVRTQLLTQLYKEYAAARIVEEKEKVYIEIIDRGLVPTGPSRPQPKLMGMAAAGVGFLIALFIAFTLDSFAKDRARRQVAAAPQPEPEQA